MPYRPWWFPEYNPQQQKKFDLVLKTIVAIFQQHQFEHIRTPAVEPIDIIMRWGDIVDKQVYGLYWLAQWTEDTKDYALHFDLTIPLARYILDHRNDITFPFKRYQIQPVWRWERTKRWRYKEFWQFDVDVTRNSNNTMSSWYDSETIFVLDRAMQTVVDTFNLKINRICKISHIWLTKERLESLEITWTTQENVLWLLDNYFKINREEFEHKLLNLVTNYQSQIICALIDTKDYSSHMSSLPSYNEFHELCNSLSRLWVSYEYDVCIVRWHSYYKWMVCEWFDNDDIALWSLAAWGRYNNITDFIDNKQSFSWVGTSLGRFVYRAVDHIQNQQPEHSYLVINFSDTAKYTQSLYKELIEQWLSCGYYPTASKLSKQFEYADKKWITHCIIAWPWEVEQGTYTIKNLHTWEETTHPYDYHIATN